MNGRRQCIKCGVGLAADAVAQRRYCSTGCRRAAEYEARRIDADIGRLEQMRRNFTHGLGGTDLLGDAERNRELARIGAALQDADARLKDLLEGLGNDA